MSYSQRYVQIVLAGLIGVGTGYYVFDPLLRQYAADTRGTFDPKIAQASTSGGAGGGMIKRNDEDGSINRKDHVISGDAARQRLEEVLSDSHDRAKESEFRTRSNQIAVAQVLAKRAAEKATNDLNIK